MLQNSDLTLFNENWMNEYLGQTFGKILLIRIIILVAHIVIPKAYLNIYY